MQSVIIYRNPLEAMLWERAMQGAPEILPGMVLALLTFLILYLVGSKIWTKERYMGG